MADPEFRMHVQIAWWLKPYLYVLAFFCVLSGREPDQTKLEAKIKRAMRITVK